MKDLKNPRKDPVDSYQGYVQVLDKILEDPEEKVVKLFARSFKRLFKDLRKSSYNPQGS